MKKIFVASILFMFAFMVSAQQGGGQRGQMTPEQLAQFQAQQFERMKTDLTLTDKQVADIKKVYDEYTPKQNDLRQKYMGQGQGGDMEKFREESTKLNDERNAKIKPLITADQYTKYLESFGRGFGGGQQGRPGGGGPRQN